MQLIEIGVCVPGCGSAPLTSAMANLCKGVSVPAMTVPFNLIGLLIFTNLPALLTQPMTGPSAQVSPLPSLRTTSVEPDLKLVRRIRPRRRSSTWLPTPRPFRSSPIGSWYVSFVAASFASFTPRVAKLFGPRAIFRTLDEGAGHTT